MGRRPGRDPAFAGPGRWLVPGLIAMLALVGLFFLVGGLLALADGHQDSWLPALLGVQLLVLGVLGVTAMVPGRRTAGTVEEVDGGVALPLRRGYAWRQALLVLTLSSVLLPVAVADDNAAMVVVGSVVLAAGVAAALWLLLGGAGRFRIRLDPEGLSLPSGWGTVRHLSWSQVEGAQVVAKWQPVLVVLPKDDRVDLGLVKLLAQGWSPESLTRVIEHYADHPAQRSELTSAAAVEPFGLSPSSSAGPSA
jgi:4-amino-4-deoxy-L-arabinose transferase-like glycosyltransferase